MPAPARQLLYLLTIIAGLAVAALAVLLWQHEALSPPEDAPQAAAERLSDEPVSPVQAPREAPPTVAPEDTAATEAPSARARARAALEDLDPGELFLPDGTGILPRDARTRMALETLDARLPDTERRQEMAALRDWLDEALPGPAAEDAQQLFRAWRAYQDELRESFPHGRSEDGLEAARERLDGLMALRRKHFGEQDGQALFATGEAQSRFYLEAMAVQRDPDLTERQRRERTRALRKNLPDEAAELHRRAVADPQLREQVRRLREQGASEAEVQHLREQHLGVEAAERLRRMDQRRRERAEQYRAVRERAAPIFRAGLDERDRREQLDALLRQHYDKGEIPAVRARLERQLAEE